MTIVPWEALFGILLVLKSIAVSTTVPTVLDASCPNITQCPIRAETCNRDEDCSLDSVCCNSPCGKVCTKQLHTGVNDLSTFNLLDKYNSLTSVIIDNFCSSTQLNFITLHPTNPSKGCQTLRSAATRRAKSLGSSTRGVRIPRCNSQGAFEKIQCDNEIDSSCWCVDEAGFEIAGTRAPSAAEVNCTDPKPCAAQTCRMFCEHGFALTKEGCPLCRCRDLCDDVKCPDALDCHLEELACADPPCPPIPTCKKGRSLNNICPIGDPLRISDTIRPFLCGNDPGKPTCPPLYQCLVQTGNDYGVCCPASLKIQKAGSCPVPTEKVRECGNLCSHDLECPSVMKCCNIDHCGSSCTHPQNITECIHQKALSELLAVSERTGRGYVPQCSEDGEFEAKQCSRNGLVCWCVDAKGRKVKGTMGAAENVNCSITEGRAASVGRSINDNNCQPLDCAAVCEYGFKTDENGCQTCKCDDPCEGFVCPEDEECVNAKEASCADFLCPSVPVCRPRMVYANPCVTGTPLVDETGGNPVMCSQDGEGCPDSHDCVEIEGSTRTVCCPRELESIEEAASEQSINADDERPQTMCEYLRDFSESMEGTRDGMLLALSAPVCDGDGNYVATQCHGGDCWCVDHFGTEIPKTRAAANETTDCEALRASMDCLDLTCRMGCEYGFVLSEETGCPLCQCRDPCSGIKCGEQEQCQLVEVSCKDHYCPPVPACLPRKIGQCPYLVPATSNSCDFECNSDLTCNGTTRCCSNGCGTQCVEPLLYTACQHQQTLIQHQARESGTPAGKVFIPKCTPDGAYEPKQCDPSLAQCWCVDFRGFELSRTRVSVKENLVCDHLPVNDKCPLRKCVDDCAHGYEMDKNGCRTCECIDPCSKVSCRGEGETCRLVTVECVNGFCPPVPMCLPKRENPCQHGEPLKLTGSEELVSCGPDYESCPSSHKCQLSPVGEYAVCCPKPRDVCFEPLDEGKCNGEEDLKNLTRYYFNTRSNKCESFVYNGCQGNHNNFHTEEMCRLVCPVLSQCERLREKNQKAAERYKRPTFAPRCDPETGVWQPVQCLEHVDVCWCVTPQGEPLKGTLIRGTEPKCNFRQARNRMRDRSDNFGDADLVLEELMMQIGSLENDYDSDEKADESIATMQELPHKSRCEALGAQCDENEKFLPMQCDQEICWCVDESGNQLPHSNSFRKGDQICTPTPIESVDITLGFRGEYDDVTAVPVVNKIARIVHNLKGTVGEDGMNAEVTNDVLFVKFSLIGSNKVDVAYRLEQMIMQQRLADVTADITRSRFTHRLGTVEPPLALEHREIVSQSPVSVVAPYHTALIVIAAASAFVISVLTVLVILYKRKMSAMHAMENKVVVDNERFLSCNRPIYIELPSEKAQFTTPDVKPVQNS